MPQRPRLLLLLSSLLLGSSVATHAQGTHQWTEDSLSDFERGTPVGVALGSDGTVSVGPSLRMLAQLNTGDVWAVAADTHGNVYAATGSPAQVVKVTPDGKQSILFITKDLSIQALAIGPDGDLYAATLPSGKVFRLDTSAGKPLDETTAAVVFDPAQTEKKPKYIWAITFDKQGRMYLGAGAPGGVYRVAISHNGAPGKPEFFFESDEPHIRSLLFTPNGDLLAGSDGSGLVYRIDHEGKGFVAFEAGKREITSLALGSAGQVYVSAVGEKGRDTSLPPLAVQSSNPAAPAAIPSGTVTITVVQPGSTQAVTNNTNVPDGSEIYLLPASASDAPRRLWADHEEVIYSLRATGSGLMAATGNHGRIFLIHDDGTYADIAHTQAAQVTGLVAGSGGTTVAATANSGKLFLLGSTRPDTPPTLTSDVFDANQMSQWGRAEWVGGASGAKLEARVGNLENPLRGWSDWKPVTTADPTIGQPAARYAQWRLTFAPDAAPVHALTLNYLPANAAPVVDEILVAVGTRVNQQAVMPSFPQQTTLNFASQGGNGVNIDNNSPQAPLSAIKDKTGVTVRWAAHDDNGDDLRFDLFYQSIGETNWHLLKKDLTDRYFTFDANLLPDGPYRLRVVGTDAPSHSLGQSLSAEKISDLFVIDTETPSVSAISAQRNGSTIHVAATATDAKNPIAHAMYSLDAGQWQFVEPVGRLSDALTEQYSFDVPLPKDTLPGTHVLTLRVFDRFENEASGKAEVK